MSSFMRPRVVVTAFLSLAALLPTETRAQAGAGMSLAVDATEAARRILHARMAIPATAGPMTLVYPKWIPGEHAPTGLINDIVGLKITAGGKTLPWRRDVEDAYSVHTNVPEGSKAIDVVFDYVTATGGRGAASPSLASSQLAILKWNFVVLYPKGADPGRLPVAASVRLPAGWRFATALPVATRTGNGAAFKPVSLETLVDSPLVAGVHARALDLSPPSGPPHTLHVFGDSAESLDLKEAAATGFGRLVTEAGTLFGAWPYGRYHFLLSLSDHVPHGGLEHHESSDNRVGERTLIEEGPFALRASLLPHELVHAWNGKHRRPAGLVTTDFQQPMKTDLLWVYEGLTTYLGEVLAARSGLRSQEIAREALALGAANMDGLPGRLWRPLADTAAAAPVLSRAVREWRGLRRGLDYYPESVLIWLEADVIVRRKTDGRKSLDDFCRAFAGGTAKGVPSVVPYGLDDVLRALDAIAPHDWRGFFQARVYTANPRAPLAGLEQSGWRLVYRDTPTAFFKHAEQAAKEIDLALSLGLVLREDGTVVDVLPGTPAARAGLGPAMKIHAANGRRLSRDVLRAAVRATKVRPDVDLLAEADDHFRTYRLTWRGGDRYPALDRIPDRPDLLGAIFSPRAPARRK